LISGIEYLAQKRCPQAGEKPAGSTDFQIGFLAYFRKCRFGTVEKGPMTFIPSEALAESRDLADIPRNYLF